MSTRDQERVAEFVRCSYLEVGSLQGDAAVAHGQVDRPGASGGRLQLPPFAPWRAAPSHTLSQVPPLTLGDVRSACAQWRSSRHVRTRPKRLTIAWLSTLLYYTYGVSRFDVGPGAVWPIHRFAPSARCFFPTEVAIWVPDTGTLEAGIYAYDALHHCLLLRRAGDSRAMLGRCVGASLDGCELILFVSSRFWRTAFLYGSFAYRLCTEEAGIVVANALLVAAAMGWYGRVRYTFLDRHVNRLLGCVPGEESVLAVVPLSVSQRQVWPLERLSETVRSVPRLEEILPIAPAHATPEHVRPEAFEALIEMDRLAMLEDVSRFLLSSVPAPPGCDTNEERIAPPTPLEGRIELADALQRRDSGDVDFRPRLSPLPYEHFWEIVRSAAAPYASDLHDGLAPPQPRLYVAVNTVERLPAGVYRYCAACGGLHVVRQGEWASELRWLRMQTSINWRWAQVICYLVGDLAAAVARGGPRAYRLLNMEAGLMGQRLGVMAAAFGSSARYSNATNVPACRDLLGLADADLLPLAEIILGRDVAAAAAAGRWRVAVAW